MKRNYLNLPQVITFLFMVAPLATVSATDMSMTGIMNGTLIKWVMNGVVVLSLIPIINVEARRDFGVPIGLSAGFVGMIFPVNARYTPWARFFYFVFLGMAMALLLGYFYAKILDHLKLNKEIVGTFAGYSFIPVMDLFYTSAPVTSRQMLYPIRDQGLRPKVGLEPYFGQVPDRLWQVRIGELVIPTGLLLFFLGTDFLLWLLSKTGAGMIFSAATESERFVRLAGINMNGYRTVAIIMSTVITAAGVVVYSQSYGILHLYGDPSMMSLLAVPATVIGGVSPRKTTVTNALIGTFLYQTACLLPIPVANALPIPEMTEIMKAIIISGIILYASTFGRKDMRNEAH